MRLFAGLLICFAAVAQTGGPVAVQLSLVAPKTVYKTGEAIQLSLAFTAQQIGFTLNLTTTSPASPVDHLLVTSTHKAVRWLDDQNGGHPYSPDFEVIQELAPGKTETIPLVLNTVYRFDIPGRYALQVITKRLHNLPALTTNTVVFDIEPMEQAEETSRAAMLEGQIRNASDLKTARLYAEQLGWLAGDAAAKVKLSLFLHPKTFYPFVVDVSDGLWITADRNLIVNGLEQGLRDSSVATSALLSSLFSLKNNLNQVPFEQLEDRYLTEIAGTFAFRSGKSLAEAATTVFLRRAQRQKTEGEDFLAAREALITNFSDVNDFSLELLLTRYSTYFLDGRVAPALREFLARQQAALFSSTRAAALQQLVKIASRENR